MKYSDKLNGFWEEGYHYYLEIRDDKLTVRDYMKRISIETGISYDVNLLETDAKTLISMEDNVLSRDYQGGMMSEIKELYYEGGKLFLLYNYTIMGETLYTLNKVDDGPFRNIIIHDEELERLQGEWVEWRPSDCRGDYRKTLTIEGNEVSLGGYKEKVRCISYTYAPDKLVLLCDDLIKNDICGFTSFNIKEDMITAYMQVTDMDIPMTVFTREGMLDSIEVPPEALKKPRNTMVNNMNVTPSMTADSPNASFMNTGAMAGMLFPAGTMSQMQAGMFADGKLMKVMNCGRQEKEDLPQEKVCPLCGVKASKAQNFCPECGNILVYI